MPKAKAAKATSPNSSEPARVQDVMTNSPSSCREHDTANEAARIMW